MFSPVKDGLTQGSKAQMFLDAMKEVNKFSILSEIKRIMKKQLTARQDQCISKLLLIFQDMLIIKNSM